MGNKDKINTIQVSEIVTDLDKLSIRSDEINVTEIKEIKFKGQKSLRATFENKEELEHLVSDLKNTLRANKNGVGLSAIQIGVNKRVFVINFNGDIRTYINPSISASEQMGLNREGCLSLPEKEFLIPRYSRIKINYVDPRGFLQEGQLFGMAAYVFQHELDHLEGVVLSDIGLEIDKDFDNATEEEKDKIVEIYIKSLKDRANKAEQEVESDKDLKQIKDAVNFEIAKATGEVETVIEELDFETQNKIKKKIEQDK